MGRRPCCEKEGLNRGAWTAMEDKILTDYISLHGEGKWRNLPLQAGLKRCGKSCRLRWLNYLKPDIKRGNITLDEEDLIIRLHKLLGNRWSLIAGRLPGRTDNEIKNYWNSNLGKTIGTRQLPFDDHTKINPPSPTAQKTCVVRTKATRCTKVVISQDMHLIKNMNSGDKDNHENNKVPIIGVTENNNNVGANGKMLLEPGPPSALDDSNSSDLKMDVDMGMGMDHILSRVLETDFSLFSDLGEHHNCQQGGGEMMSLSPLSNDTLFLNEDEHGGLDADWIRSLLLQSEFVLETSN